jgi:hypothetical protein
MSLKRSSTCSKTYTGSDGEKELIISLEFLFYVKGKEYNKKYPDFILPSAQEFLGVCRTMSDEIYDKSRKTIAISKYQHGASKRSVKKILNATPFHSVKCGPRKELFDFLNYIHSNQSHIISNRVILSLATVLYAITLYTFTNSCLENIEGIHLKEASHTLGTMCKAVYSKPIVRFCTQYMHILSSNIPMIVGISHDFIKERVSNELIVYFNEHTIPMTTSTSLIITSGLEQYYIQSMALKKVLFKPLTHIMYDDGFRV